VLIATLIAEKGRHVTEAVYDRKETFRQVESGLMDGETIIACTTRSAPARVPGLTITG